MNGLECIPACNGKISSPSPVPFSYFLAFLLTVAVLSIGWNFAQADAGADKRRIFIVSSYDRNYLWSQSTHADVTAAMLHYGYLDNETQAQTLAAKDYVKSSRAVVKKAWMNTQRYNSGGEMAMTTMRIMDDIGQFQPHLGLLGDDNAVNYIGNQLLDTEIPVVFWGINGLPIKYGLVDSMDCPGHNVNGVCQAGYHKESMELLHELVPEVHTFAILACDSVTSTHKVKQITALDRQGKPPRMLLRGDEDQPEWLNAVILFERLKDIPWLLSSGNMEWFMLPRVLQARGPFITSSGVPALVAGLGKLDKDTGLFGDVVMIRLNLERWMKELRGIRFFDTNPVWVTDMSGNVLPRPGDPETTFDPCPTSRTARILKPISWNSRTA